MKLKGMTGRSSNKYELDAAQKLITKGYRVFKKGWPDFLAFHPETKEIVLVEVKRREHLHSGLRGAQGEMRKILSKHFDYYLLCFNKAGKSKPFYTRD